VKVIMFRQLILAATIALSTGGADAAVTPAGSVAWGADMVETFATHPRAPWQADDPADSLYKAAREQLNRSDYRAAIKSFALIVERYPKSTYAGDAMYWQAYANYRIGETAQLREALRVLDEQRRRYPKAATRGDADALAVRVRGTLARQGDNQSAEDIAKVAKGTPDQACSRSGDDDDDTRTAALNALLQMNAERAVPIIKAVLAKRDACSAGLREKAVFLLSQKRSPETEDMMLDVVKNDPSREVRKKAVFWLGQVNTDRAAAALEQMLASNTMDEEMREQAVFALMQQRSARGQAAVRAIAQDPNAPDGLREKAVFWIGQQRSPENAAFLRGLFDKLASAPQGSSAESIRQKILFSLSQMRGEGNDKWLMEVAADPKHSVETRKQAIFSAGQIGVATADLAALYPKLNDRELKGQLIWVMSEKRDSGAIDRLIQIAKSDPDREMRKKAIFWLGQSDDPRVKDLLLDIINGPR
jgi:TolA-binding protein